VSSARQASKSILDLLTWPATVAAAVVDDSETTAAVVAGVVVRFVVAVTRKAEETRDDV